MSDTPEVDVIVGGGGVAGAAAAAAIAQLGYQVMVVEPGQRGERRLAGEVFHPPGVSGLAELGLLGALRKAPAVDVSGFSVTCSDDYIRLPYDSVAAHLAPGLCLEHGVIRERMMSSISLLSNVAVKEESRVVAIDQSHPSHVVVGVANGSGSTSYRCRMFVAADGSPSRLARLAGIAIQNRLISTIWGYRIGATNLPQSNFGHVFLGAPTPVLLYPIGRDRARILFDIPYRPANRPTEADCLEFAKVLPCALREEVAHTIATQSRMSVVTRATTAAGVCRGRVVLVGDAGGSCHPLTATGMTMCVSDALLLRDALAECPRNLPDALLLYQRRRRWPQATRLVLADTLRDALCGATPELRVVRAGILALWRDSAEARSATVALLSTADGRLFALVRQIIAAIIRGFVTHIRSPKPENRGIGIISLVRVLMGSLVRNLRRVLKGARTASREEVAYAPDHAPAADAD
jgi:squalene monooxygenase